MSDFPIIIGDIPDSCRGVTDPELFRKCVELSKRLPKTSSPSGTPTPGGGNPSKDLANIPWPVPRADEGIDVLLRKMVDGLAWNSASLRRSELELAAIRSKLASP